jgi:hypothetical protein
VKVTTGFRPACACFGHFEEVDDGEDWITREGGARRTRRVYVPDGEQPNPVPCTVLDPFSGSGTTGVVAQKLGRNYVGLDLSAEYLALARERTGLKAMDEWTNGRQVEATSIQDLPLFAAGVP